MPKILTLNEINNRLLPFKFGLIDKYQGLCHLYNFHCPGCGKLMQCSVRDIINKKISSCGCLRGRARRRGTKNVPMDYFTTIKKHAIIKSYIFNISIEYIDELLVLQNFKCKLSQIPIQLFYNGIKKSINTASLDRINNELGYQYGNVQWLHKDVNWMKQDFNEKYFVSLCTAIASNN